MVEYLWSKYKEKDNMGKKSIFRLFLQATSIQPWSKISFLTEEVFVGGDLLTPAFNVGFSSDLKFKIDLRSLDRHRISMTKY